MLLIKELLYYTYIKQVIYSMRRVTLQKYVQKLKETSTSQLNVYINSLKFPLPPNNAFCRELYQQLKMYQEDKNRYNNLKPIIAKLNYETYIKKTKNPLCGGILKNGDKAFKCYDCITEDNSILCINCFDLSKHIGHKFQRLSVGGGCCDCGDIQKWKQQGFCSQHKVQQQLDIIIDEQLENKYIIQQQYALTIILQMYNKFIQIKKNIQETSLSQYQNQNLLNTLGLQGQNKFKEQSTKKIIEYIELYTCLYFNQLIQFNKAGQYAHHMTFNFLNSIISVKYQFLETVKLNPTVFNTLFTFKMLQLTANYVCDLCISMFSFHNFKEQLVIFYFKMYISDPSFLMTGYNALTAQLLTSHITMSKVIKKQLIQPLSYRPLIALQSNLEVICQSFVRYYCDIFYLSKLYGTASIQYFQFIAKKQQISNLGYYRQLLNQHPQSVRYYGLQNLFLDKMQNIVKLASKDQTNTIYIYSLKDLYKFMTTFQTKNNNFFRPQERLFTMMIFSSINYQLETLDNDEQIIKLLEIFESKDLKSQFQALLSNAFNIIAVVAQNMQNLHHEQYYTWLHYYIRKKDMILFSLDTIYIKILLKISDYYNRTVKKQQQKINYNMIIYSNLKSFKKIKNYYIPQGGQTLLMTTLNNLTMNPLDLTSLNNYLYLIYQILQSDLHQLKLLCYFRKNQIINQNFNFKVQKIFKEKIMYYYQNILRSCQNQRVFIKDFKQKCQYFINQQIIFKQFVKIHVDKNDHKKLISNHHLGQSINYSYFTSIANQFKNDGYFGPLNVIPYYKKSKLSCFFIENVDIFYKAFQYMKILLQSIAQQQNPNVIQVIIRNNYKKYLTLSCILYCHTDSSQTKHQLQQYFSMIMNQNHINLKNNKIQDNTFKKYIIENEILIKQIKSYIDISSKSKQNIQDQNEKSTIKLKLKDQQRKLKLQNKKKLILNKINKDKQSYLGSKKIQQHQVQQEICYLCKQNNNNQILYCNAFVTIINFNLWFNLGKNKFPFFNTCGHMVHQGCYKKTVSKNQIYNFCILCKQPVNILISSNITQNIKDKNIQLSFWKQYQGIRTILQQNYHHIDEVKTMISSIIIMTALKSVTNHDSYHRSFGLIKLIIPFIKAQYQQSPQSFKQCLSHIQYNQNNQKVKHIFRFVETLFMKQLGINQIHQQQNSLNQVSMQFEQKIRKYLHYLFSEEKQIQNTNYQSQQRQILLVTMNKPQIDSILNELSVKYLKKCNYCSQITQNQAICLICKDYSTCIGCSKQGLMAHSLQHHLGICSFLCTSTGQIIYIYQGRFWKYESIYQDFIGRSYQQNRDQDKSQFILNKNKFNEYCEDIKNFNIQSRLRYHEKVQGKVYHSVKL